MTYEVGTVVKNDLGDEMVVIPGDVPEGFTRCVWVTVSDPGEKGLVGEIGAWPTELLERK